MRVAPIVPVTLVALFALTACDRLSPTNERAPTTTVVVTDPQRPTAAPAATPAPTAPLTTFACGKGTCRSDEVCCSEACIVCAHAGTVCPQKIDCPAAKATPTPTPGKAGGVTCGYDQCAPGQICCPGGCASGPSCDPP